ncbi:MAG: hypothetical protein HDR90_06020 [Bacteroides sp.]|nr:hypothetical protein [Bacteroides sp.]
MMHYVVLFTVCILVFIFSKSMKATMWALFFFLVGLVCLLVEQPMWGLLVLVSFIALVWLYIAKFYGKAREKRNETRRAYIRKKYYGIEELDENGNPKYDYYSAMTEEEKAQEALDMWKEDEREIWKMMDKSERKEYKKMMREIDLELEARRWNDSLGRSKNYGYIGTWIEEYRRRKASGQFNR